LITHSVIRWKIALLSMISSPQVLKITPQSLINLVRTLQNESILRISSDQIPSSEGLSALLT
jgi:hypothetical protein